MLKRLWWPSGSLRHRIGAIIIIHALLVYATFLLFTRSGQLPTDRLYLLPSPDRVTSMVLAFERAPPDTYPDLTRAFQDDRQNVRLLRALPPLRTSMSSDGEAAARAAKPYRAALAGRPFRIEANGQEVSRALDRQPYFSRTPLRVIVELPNGRAVEIVRFTVAPVARFITRFKWFGLAIAAVDLLVIFWLAAQSTAPVERLLRAVRADDLAQLEPSGAKEFLELGEAFREMRGRLDELLEERTRIVAAVAHDFRTYLTRLELRSDFIADPRQRALASRDLDVMRQLMDDALTFARPVPPDSNAGGAIDIARELEHIVEARGDQGEDVMLVMPDEHLLVRATPLAFQRMMANLLDNASRYGAGPHQRHRGRARSGGAGLHPGRRHRYSRGSAGQPDRAVSTS